MTGWRPFGSFDAYNRHIPRRRWAFGALVGAVIVAAASGSGAASPPRQQSVPLTTLAPANTVAPIAVPDPAVFIDDEVGSGGNLISATPVTIGGPRVDVATEQSSAFVFTAPAGQAIAVRSNREWALFGPLGDEVERDMMSAVTLPDTGRYLLTLEPGLKPPASVQVTAVEPTAIVLAATVGQPVRFNLQETRTQYARISLRGGQRYRLVVPNGQRASVCVHEVEAGVEGAQHCQISSTSATPPESATSFVLPADEEVHVTAEAVDPYADDRATAVTARIEEMPNDVFASPGPSPIVQLEPTAGQGIVVPFWGDPSERAVLSSPVAANVSAWGDPWIDREDSAADGRVKVYAVPYAFDPAQPPFVTWRGSTPPNPPNKQRVGVYRGEDTAADIPVTGDPVLVRNLPWFASIGSLTFEAGGRYVLQVVGTDIRPLSLAVRDPSGKFTSSLSPWQWTEANGEQRAITTVSANRPGRWALEMRLAGNNVRALKVSALKVGGGGSYEGVVDVDDVLSVGDSTDVQLGPNEFARLSVKMRSASPQIVQPDVQRYRNKTFQPTAVDMSLWDSRGRLVWSNNRNLEEEVLSGRLGKEPQLSERFATVSNIEPYTLIIDPHTDLAGRFRVSIASTPVSSDVLLTGSTPGSAIPLLEGGTKTGVAEVRQPTRYRLTGASVCLVSTSTAEWSSQVDLNPNPTPVPLAATVFTPNPGRCVSDGNSITLPTGVHRFAFSPPLTKTARFGVVPAASRADTLPSTDAAIDGATTRLPPGIGTGVVRFATTRPATRLVMMEDSMTVGGTLVLPDGTNRSVRGPFLATLAGSYTFHVSLNGNAPRILTLRSAVSEVQATSLAVGARNRIVAMRWGQRLEAVVILGSRTRVGIDSFADRGSHVALALIADDRERRYLIQGGSVVLPAGRYRFVFVGNGDVRIALKKLPLNGG